MITEHFSMAELTTTNTGLPNKPDNTALDNLYRLALTLEKIRVLLGGAPMTITSAYRSPGVNKKVGGSPTSAHLSGLAADFIAPKYGTPLEIVERLKTFADFLDFDQLIEEGTWVHVGIFRNPRRQVLTASFDKNGKASYKEMT